MPAVQTALWEFADAYANAVATVLPYLGQDRLGGLGRHNPAWGPGRFDVATYLDESVIRYGHALRLLAQSPSPLAAGASVLDVGGFMGAFPLTLVRLGYRVTLSERYDYYDGAFDDLCARLIAEGVEVLDVDFTEDEISTDRRFDAITNMAMLEHLAHTPKPLMGNLRNALVRDGVLVVEVPNVAYWPKRLAALFGDSTLPPLRDVYDAAVPFTGHHREYTKRDLRNVLEWSGFRVDDLISYNYTPSGGGPWHQRLVWEWPQQRFQTLREVLMARASLSETTQ